RLRQGAGAAGAGLRARAAAEPQLVPDRHVARSDPRRSALPGDGRGGRRPPAARTGGLTMRVCVVGMGKSGTTALLYAIRAAMPAGTQGLFEPRTFVAVTAHDAAAKVLLHPKHPMPAAFYGQFDKLVLIVR